MWLLLIGYQGIILDLKKLPLDQLTGWFHMKSISCFWGSGWFWGVLPYCIALFIRACQPQKSSKLCILFLHSFSETTWIFKAPSRWSRMQQIIRRSRCFQISTNTQILNAFYQSVDFLYFK
jgi:hypothetical protein